MKKVKINMNNLLQYGGSFNDNKGKRNSDNINKYKYITNVTIDESRLNI
jgi:hypothetical protein